MRISDTTCNRDQLNIEVRAGDFVVAPMDRWRFGIVLKVFPPDSDGVSVGSDPMDAKR